MILVDTSVWIDHLRKGNGRLANLLQNFSVFVHPFVIGELACGNLRNRKKILQLLERLPGANMASDSEVLYFIEKNKLAGRGIGYVDAHLLAAAALTPGAQLWTRDRRLESIAKDMGLA